MPSFKVKSIVLGVEIAGSEPFAEKRSLKIDSMPFKNPFLKYSLEINKLFAKAKTQKNPALWLYTNNARVSFFMMESLCRIFDNGLNNPWFAHWHKTFKKLEDGLGQIDFYDVFIKEYSKNKKLSPDVMYYLQSKREKALKKFEKRMNKENYLSDGLKNFEAELKKQNINFDVATITKIEQFIKSEIQATQQFASYNNYTYVYLEDHVHELRRKLRWFGIYSMSLQGIITIQDSGQKYKWKKKYLTKEILSSPFNSIPQNKCAKHIAFEKNHFYALNWMIEELGDLKDNGLKVEIFSKAIRKTEKIEKNLALKKASLLLGIKQTEADILKKVSLLSKEFFEQNKIAEGLLYKPSDSVKFKKAPPTFKEAFKRIKK